MYRIRGLVFCELVDQMLFRKPYIGGYPLFYCQDMATAFILLNVKMGSEDQALKEVMSIKEVKEAHRVYGTYDTIVKVEADDFGEVKRVIETIRGLKEIRSTLTLIVNG